MLFIYALYMFMLYVKCNCELFLVTGLTAAFVWAGHKGHIEHKVSAHILPSIYLCTFPLLNFMLVFIFVRTSTGILSNELFQQMFIVPLLFRITWNIEIWMINRQHKQNRDNVNLLLNHKQLQSNSRYEIVVYNNIWKKVSYGSTCWIVASWSWYS